MQKGVNSTETVLEWGSSNFFSVHNPVCISILAYFLCSDKSLFLCVIVNEYNFITLFFFMRLYSESDEDYTPSSCTQPKEGPSSAPRPRKRKAPSSFHPKRGRGDSLVQEEKWHNREEEDITPQPLRFMPARKPGPTFDTTTSWSPLSLFQLFFSQSVVRTIIDNTNANAARRLQAGIKFVWRALTLSDFFIFMAILIFTSLVSVHHRADYWRKVWPYNFPFPADKMTRDRFEAILWSLHLSNPEEDEENERKRNTADYDRLFKIKPLYTDMVTACQAHFQPYQMISIDERMVASKARHSMKQYQKDKPTKWGYKLFVLTDSSTGFTWNFFVYTGKSVSTTGQGLSYSSVLDLLPFSMLDRGYMLFVDNFYTSPALFRDLRIQKSWLLWHNTEKSYWFSQNSRK
uniref:Si:ch73-353p21.4 n=1 Tax=Iconisemion striatum TaxID=60296 RepID=A0A1A7YLU1_9TELE